MHRIDGPGATPENRFTEGNPTTGQEATQVTADFLNAIQEEIIAVLAAAGISPNKANNTQLAAAITALISGGGVAVTAAGVTVADLGDFFTSDNVEAALAQLAEKLYEGTLQSKQVIRPVITLAGAAHQTEAAHAEAIVELSHSSTITYTVRADADYDAPIGAQIVLIQAGAGKVQASAAGGVTLLKPSVFNAATLGQHAQIVLCKTAANTWRVGGMLEAA